MSILVPNAPQVDALKQKVKPTEVTVAPVQPVSGEPVSGQPVSGSAPVLATPPPVSPPSMPCNVSS